MFARFKLLLLEGLRKSYNIRLIKLLLRNYILIFPKWINSKNIRLYLGLTFFVVFWLHYEIFRVSPVCAYYTGPDFPSLLNKFKSVGKTYRPTIYLFNSKLQWLFLKLYCRLEFSYKLYKYRFLQGSSSVLSLFYKVATLLNHLVLKSFFYKKIFVSQPPISLREVVEGHNGSLVVMDWYLPKWISPECKTCGLFKQDESFYTTDNTPSVFSKMNNHMDLNKTTNSNQGENTVKDEYFKMYTIESVNQGDNAKEGDSDNESPLSSHSSFSSSSATDVVNNKDKPLNEENADLKDVNITDLAIEQMKNFPVNLPISKNINEKFEFLDRQTDSPNPKIVRGVLVIVGDTNVSYRICSTRAGCYCNSKLYEYNHEACQTCNENDMKDYEGFNLEHPGFPTLRSLINDSLRSGFACVHLHLNVNLGMAPEAFPECTTLRSFPISLYSDVLIDLDCALNKVSERFPNCSLVTVGLSFGSNILMEYLSVSSQGGTYKLQSDSDIENYNDYVTPKDRVTSFTRTENPEFDSSKLDEDNKNTDYNDTSVSDLKNLGNLPDLSPLSRNSYSVDKLSNTSSVSQITRNSSRTDLRVPLNESPIVNGSKVSEGSVKSMIPTKPSTEPLYDDHFAMDYHKEESTTETKLVFPEHNTHIVLNPEKIAAAVCINLNLKLSSNVLYNISKKKFKKLNMYKKFCLSTFKEQICGLLNSVHCRRTNTSLLKDCINFNCCHHRMVSKFGFIKKLFYRIFTLKNKIKSVHNYSTEKLITQLHREYRQSYRDLRKEDRNFINYGTFLFDRFGVRTPSGFKVSVLMTLKHRFEREGPESKIKIRHITEPPIYRYINKKVNTNLRLGNSVFTKRSTKLTSNVHRILDYKITKYINSLINSDYNRNLSNIKANMEFIKVPTLLLYSLDNSMFNFHDVDIFDVIKNPNIVYYISQTGGYSTFLSGIRPSTWFIGPILEFLEEMSTKSKTF